MRTYVSSACASPELNHQETPLTIPHAVTSETSHTNPKCKRGKGLRTSLTLRVNASCRSAGTLTADELVFRKCGSSWEYLHPPCAVYISASFEPSVRGVGQ